MPKLHMTDVVVSRLKACDTYYDEATPGFGLRVGKNRKTWFVIRGRERLRTSVGLYPGVTLADARKEARKLLTEEPTKASRITFDEALMIVSSRRRSGRVILMEIPVRMPKTRTRADQRESLKGLLC